MKEMEIGQLVDYVIEYNRIHGYEDEVGPQEEKKPVARQATDADWDDLWS